MPRRSVPLLLLSLCCLVLGPALASGQTTGATLLGTVFDEQGAVLPGATISITNVETGWNRVIVSDERGYYRAAALPPGQYEMKIEMTGFSAQVRSGMTLTVGQEATINVTLKLSSLEESVTVTADSPIVETTKSMVGTTINREQLDNLPIPGRNFTALANLTPGVTGVGGGGLNTGGQISRNNTFLIDGTSNDETALNTTRGSLSLETVREYVVMASQFSAEYGNASGAIVTVVTRSGTNTVQGRAFGFFRNTTLNAREFAAADLCYQAKAAGNECDPKPAFSQQRFGGTLGGPIVRDKLHYF
ncbi:MAG: carboxypeptidase regulatory-like domain-containing protein, partial [Acidobacteria bacterium]|nr:carboxypeptidase regulatory-like domain-containing protein [Acidobacteriota bacterium]